MIDTFQQAVDAADGAALDFILIGGHAVNARGYERTTVDLDFIIAANDLDPWKQILQSHGFKLVNETAAFAQFSPPTTDGMRVDLMLVDNLSFQKMLSGSEWMEYGSRRIRVAGVLHLIALKLHATRTWSRAVQGKDYYDILNLIRLNKLEAQSHEFLQILDQYATPSIKERLLSDLARHAE